MNNKDSFKQKGYYFLKNVINRKEAINYRKIIAEMGDLKDSWDIPDGVTKNEKLWSLIANKKLIDSLRSVLGDVKYTQHSDILVNINGIGWHRDSAHRKFGVGPDWDEKICNYNIVRVGLYLFENKLKKPFKLGLVPKSNRKDNWFNQFYIDYLYGLCTKLLSYFNIKNPLWSPINMDVEWITPELGDCIVFDQRIYHSPNDYSDKDKIVIYTSYGLDNHHSYNHIKYYRNTRKDLGYIQKFSDNLKAFLGSNNLLLKDI